MGAKKAIASGISTRLSRKCPFQESVTLEKSHRPATGMPSQQHQASGGEQEEQEAGGEPVASP